MLVSPSPSCDQIGFVAQLGLASLAAPPRRPPESRPAGQHPAAHLLCNSSIVRLNLIQWAVLTCSTADLIRHSSEMDRSLVDVN